MDHTIAAHCLLPARAGKGKLPRHLPIHLAERTAGLAEVPEQGRRPPTRAIALVPNRDLVVDLARPDLVGPKHQPAAIAREAEAVEPHDVDVAGADRLTLLQDLAGFVDRREQQAAQDLLVREWALLEALLGRHLLDDGMRLGIDDRRAVALLVAIPALAGLLAQPTHLDEAVCDRQAAI